MPDKRKLTIALSKGGALTNLASSTNKTVSWSALVETLSHCLVDDISFEDYLALPTLQQSIRKNKPGAFVGGSFSSNRRNSDSIVSRSVVTVDIDAYCKDIWKDITTTGTIPGLNGLSYQIHTTRKHTEEEPRLRVCLPLSRDVSPEEYVPLLCGVAQMIDPTMYAVTSESFVAVQVMFLPSRCKDSEFFSLSVEGSFLNPDPILDKFPLDKPDTWPSPKAGEAKPFSRLKIAHPEDKKDVAPVVTALHRTYDPRTFIETFLDHIYLPAGGRYLPVGASGAPSVRIYEDAFVQSDHGTDPARGQHNTFDLGRIHLFGDLDVDFDTDVLPLSEWPSYRAMCDWAVQQPGVAEALEDVREEAHESRLNGYLDELIDLTGGHDDDDEGFALNYDLEDELDVIDEDDDEFDLIGAPKVKKPVKKSSAEELIRRVRILLSRAGNVTELEAAVQRIQAIPTDVLSESARSVLCKDLQAAFADCGETITRANAARALKYRLPSLQERAGEDMPAWAEGWYYVYGENSFIHADTRRILSKESFDAFYMNLMGLLVGFTSSGTPIMSASTAALTVWDLPKVFGTMYRPGDDQILHVDGVTYANIFRMPTIPDDGYRGSFGVDLLYRLLDDLYPDPKHQDLILDFMAHCYRFPATKLQYALLLKGANQEGKTLLFMLLRRLLGADNCATVLSSQLKKEFNDYMEAKLVCCIEEIKLNGREGADALNNLKAPISNDYVPVEGKGTKVKTIENYANWFVFTNFEDAVPIEDNDSRWLILFSRFKSNAETAAWKAVLQKEEGGDYRTRLYNEIKDHPWQFIRFFEGYEFSDAYNPDDRAPDTVFKRLMNEDGRSEERTVLEELLEDGDHPLITEDFVQVSELKDVFDEKGIGVSFRGRGIAVLMKSAGFTKCGRSSFTFGDVTYRSNGWTRNPNFCDVEGRMTKEGAAHLKNAFERMLELEESGDIDDNIVRLIR